MPEFAPKKQEKTVISIRISEEILKQVDKMAATIDISRNEFISQSIKFALDNYSEKEK